MTKEEMLSVVKVSLRTMNIVYNQSRLYLYCKYLRTLEERRHLDEDELLYLITNTNLLEKMTQTVNRQIN